MGPVFLLLPAFFSNLTSWDLYAISLFMTQRSERGEVTDAERRIIQEVTRQFGEVVGDTSLSGDEYNVLDGIKLKVIVNKIAQYQELGIMSEDDFRMLFDEFSSRYEGSILPTTIMGPDIKDDLTGSDGEGWIVSAHASRLENPEAASHAHRALRAMHALVMISWADISKERRDGALQESFRTIGDLYGYRYDQNIDRIYSEGRGDRAAQLGALRTNAMNLFRSDTDSSPLNPGALNKLFHVFEIDCSPFL